MKKKLDNITKRRRWRQDMSETFVLDLRSIGGGREIFNTLEEAQDVRDQALADAQNKEYIPRTTNPRTVDVAQLFIDNVRTKIDSSEEKTQTHRRNTQFMFNNVPGLRDRKVMDVTTAYIEAEIIPVIFRQAHSTGLNRFDTLRQLLKFAVKNNLTRANPCSGKNVDLPKREIKFEGSPRISKADIQAIIDNAGEYALRIKFAAYTGARCGEQIATGWGDLDLDGSAYHIRNNARHGQMKTVKTKAGIRSIALPDHLVADLRKWKIAQPLKQRAIMPNKGLVFPTTEGHLADGGNWRKRGLHPACDRARIPRIRWHDLRHYYASVLLFETNLTDAQITQFIGHKSIDFTRKQYAHWRDDPRRDEALAKMMSKAFS
jgi:integrase|tara:strand:- start:582 stop:1706 length:1125 start_codon:yes stop_codon:yes gene_type:complete